MELIPLFPLETVLYPGASLPLHVFEPRFRALLRECLTHRRQFGVVAIRQGSDIDPDPPTFAVGTMARIQDIVRRSRGRSDVVVEGGDRFRLLSRVEGAAYPQAEVTPVGDQVAEWYVPTVIGELRSAYRQYRSSLEVLGLDLPEFSAFPRDPVSLAWAIADHLVVELPSRQALLEECRPLARIRRELTLLRREATFVELRMANRLVRPPQYSRN